MSEYEQEVQHAEVTVKVALPVEKELENNNRIQEIEKHVKHYLNEGDLFEFRYIIGATILHETESMEEAALRHEAEAEIAHEKKMDEKRERFFDNRGLY